MLKIFTNPLDVSESETREYQCLLTEWLAIRKQYPTARLYKDAICAQNDVTPKTKEQAWALKDANGLYQVVCHAGDPGTIMIAAAILSVATAVYTYMNMPKPPKDLGGVNGSTNNSLAQRQNQHRVGGRVPDIYGKVKSIPDLIAPVYRYYRNNIQVEECLLCVGTGYFDIKQADIKEGETPIQTIEGASISIYDPNQSLVTSTPKISIGEYFDNVPLVAKQVSSVDGKQNLVPPNSAFVETSGLAYSVTGIDAASTTITSESNIFEGNEWVTSTLSSSVDFTKRFKTGEKVKITGAFLTADGDSFIAGTARVNLDGTIIITSSTNINNVAQYRRINISSLFIDTSKSETVTVTNSDSTTTNHQVLTNVNIIDLSGSYPILSADKNSIVVSTSADLSVLSAPVDAKTTAFLTNSSYLFSLDGTYTIADLTSTKLTFVNPGMVNANWNSVGELTELQKSKLSSRVIKISGSRDNWIGWYHAGNQDSTGFMINFVAPNGISEGELHKEVAIEVQYQMVVDGVPTGAVYREGLVLTGVPFSRNPIGQTLKKSLPFKGAFRFRTKRVNDDGNGKNTNLINDVVVESAYSFYETVKMSYPLDTVVRLRRLAIGSGTNASELNMILARKINTANGFVATRNFADIVTAMATDPYIGRMQANEVDAAALKAVSNEVMNYFGTDKAAEFNYTFDDTNASYQEMIALVAEAVFCNARRENGQHYFAFERQNNNSLLLFNHRNMKPDSLTVSEAFGIKDNHDGVELKWRNPDDNYAEAVIKLPDSLRTNYKTIETRGVTNKAQAWFIANRAWNKLKYGRKLIEFTAYGEADLVTKMDRIAVVDSTVPILCAGEIEAQNNLVLSLDYPLPDTSLTGLTIHLQLKNGVVDVIDIASIIDEYTVQLSRIPTMPLVTNGVSHTAFAITAPSTTNFDAYLIEEKASQSLFETSITATLYDPRYYQNDSDFKNGLIN